MLLSQVMREKKELETEGWWKKKKKNWATGRFLFSNWSISREKNLNCFTRNLVKIGKRLRFHSQFFVFFCSWTVCWFFFLFWFLKKCWFYRVFQVLPFFCVFLCLVFTSLPRVIRNNRVGVFFVNVLFSIFAVFLCGGLCFAGFFVSFFFSRVGTNFDGGPQSSLGWTDAATAAAWAACCLAWWAWRTATASSTWYEKHNPHYVRFQTKKKATVTKPTPQ